MTDFIEKKVAEWDAWCAKEAEETGGEIGQVNLSDKVQELLQEALLKGLEMAEGAVNESKEKHGSKGEITAWTLGRIESLKKEVMEGMEV
jgi:hypothetical protein